jgi:hypothetical protein
MRKIKYEGIEHLLSDKNWQQMLKRFDFRKARLNAFGYNFIPIKSICVARSYKCIRCPLRDPHKKTNSCTYLFHRIIGDDLLRYLHIRDSGILWEPKYDAEARQALTRVITVLNQAENINQRASRTK